MTIAASDWAAAVYEAIIRRHNPCVPTKEALAYETNEYNDGNHKGSLHGPSFYVVPTQRVDTVGEEDLDAERD